MVNVTPRRIRKKDCSLLEKLDALPHQKGLNYMCSFPYVPKATPRWSLALHLSRIVITRERQLMRLNRRR